MPGNDVKGRVILGALEELATHLVDNLPWLLLDFVFCSWVQEVASIGEAVSTQGTKFRQLKLRTPDLCSGSANVHTSDGIFSHA